MAMRSGLAKPEVRLVFRLRSETAAEASYGRFFARNRQDLISTSMVLCQYD
ncbi:hypothetical protein RISK_004084 [Rhodopirellula islandica]|uniref:Uncharacterized protein n=1 Tax=Rhodopirellula islandica TaxID=595434 RepID=A0A0J1BAE1_RHOIS|nr:hypothetical protein RISK_004084 [Rhodopirellula islandica]